MMKIAIFGYGNLGRGVEAAMKYHTDCELVAVFTRRDPGTVVTAGWPVYSADDILELKD
jgi:diaminopimelate dehydrogenase